MLSTEHVQPILLFPLDISVMLLSCRGSWSTRTWKGHWQVPLQAVIISPDWPFDLLVLVARPHCLVIGLDRCPSPPRPEQVMEKLSAVLPVAYDSFPKFPMWRHAKTISQNTTNLCSKAACVHPWTIVILNFILRHTCHLGIIYKIQVKIFPVHNYYTTGHSILHIGTILSSVFSFTPQKLYPIWKLSPLPTV
jgi:hypothetical protein